MIKLLVINPIVLDTLREAYPTPPNAAENALKKYLNQAEILINDAIERGRETYDKKLNLYTIPLTELSRNGPEIGSKAKANRKRVHTVLKDLGVPILETVEKGCGIRHILTRVRINKALVQLVNITTPLDPNTTFYQRHPDFDKLTPEVIGNDYDCVLLDIEGLNAYIESLDIPGTHPEIKDIAKVKTQAERILAAAIYKNGMFYQKKKPSFFGRTYYEGSSVQSINKGLRSAMLGDCWEYDITSSVVSWKLGFAERYMERKKLLGNVADYFPTCLQYAKNKKSLFAQIKTDVFKFTGGISDEEQSRQIKDAFTALNFGAILTDDTFLGEEGVQVKRAIAKVITNKVACKSFVNNSILKAFQDEMKLLDQQIEWEAKKNKCHLFTATHPKTGKKLSKKCRMSYRYQHAETEVMNVFRTIVQQHSLTILANIHDAIILLDRLDEGLKQAIEEAMRSETNNDYWTLGAKQI